MKHHLFIFFIAITLVGCSSLELEAVSSSEEETQKILSMGLTHEENLKEANKLKSSHMISVVTLQLINARDEKIQYDKDVIKANKFSEMIVVSEDGLNFVGPEISQSIKTGVLASDIDLQKYHLEGTKDAKTGVLSHNLIFTIAHTSRDRRNYISANMCDEWNRCEETIVEVDFLSNNASNCTSSECNYEEIIELKMSDNFIREYFDKAFVLRLNSKKNTTKFKISNAYLMGYLDTVQ
jgi:hypothetical protein